ncbi:CHAT domain-containing protein [Dolichospermum sp. UHCC 0684]|uniref:CHAT domain-containing protein n=1 Tax=unclassified Dolichospermum TaxID=2622029 RepID=UPI00144808F2|nr:MULTISPECIES: CHAT domain-containing protein [unclassified Dolichospermum]MEA5531772.1 CHAT domain-containing protein [Dolichospermum sp. UHCC 0684]MTJ33130.1 CHAT domain-containing protein [Dolichospermum sp. UHCC 0260]
MSLRLRLISWLTSPLLLTLIPSLLPIPSYLLSTTAQAQTSQDQKTEADKLLEQGNQQFQRSQYKDAIQSWQQALVIYQQLKDRKGETNSLNNLGNAYNQLGQYPKAIEFYQQVLTIVQGQESFSEVETLSKIGLLYKQLGQYTKAVYFYEKSLSISQHLSDFLSRSNPITFYESLSLQIRLQIDIGNIYADLGDYAKAIQSFEQSLDISNIHGNQKQRQQIIINFGKVYAAIGDYIKAFEYLQQSLKLAREIGDRQGELEALATQGSILALTGNTKGLNSLQQSLLIARAVGDKKYSTEKVTLSNIGSLFQELKKPKLAIIFYKKSVNLTEAIRKDLQTLPRDQQESYTQTVADTYRSLADLLISQGRVLEAQQVLELLKIQELRDFTRNARAGGETAGIALSRIEEDILNKYGTLIVFGLKLYECEQQKCNSLSQLRDQLDTLTQQFNQDTNTFRKTLQERLAKDPALLEPEQVRNTAAKIVTAEPDTILVYPLVLKDKIRILLATRAGEKGVVFRTFETPVNQQQLWNKVSQFRTQLSNPNGEKELKATSQELYNWLIKPLEGEIKDKNVRNLVFSLDRSTRYIPMAALFDGKQYLIERYGISTILNAGLTDVKDRLPSKKQDIKVLAMGVSKAFPGFNALSNVPIELANIVQQSGKENTGIFPGSEFLDEAFIFRTLRDNLSGNRVLHIATHGKFESGRPENSFLLSGTGDKLTVEQIQTLQNYMKDTHLVVLSACETALGGVDADGIEMSGISFYFLTNGAKAVIASLWLVNDASTSQLMQQFYQNRHRVFCWTHIRTISFK